MKRLISLIAAAILLAGLGELPASSAVSDQVSALDTSELRLSYEQLTSQFYQKLKAQSVLDGVRAGLLKALKTANVAGKLPPIIAAADSAQNERAIGYEVNVAARLAKSHPTAHLLSQAAIAGMLDSAHDKYTTFLSPKDYAQFNQDLDGNSFGGVGVVIQADDQTKYIDIDNIVPDGPADKAGIKQDDVITAINGLSTKGMDRDTASKNLRGAPGTQVTLTIERDGTTLPAPLTVTRAIVRQQSVFERMLPGKIGYVVLTVFGRETGTELTAALDRLQRDGARAIVMDLRDNGGGYLDAAVAVSSKFIPMGPIVSVESRASNITTIEADDTAISPVPLAVLVNAYTASASEITSGAIQDSGVGTLIGTKTFGKGVVQTIFPLPDGSAIKITTARYLTPRNRDINHLGITPDLKVDEKKGDLLGDIKRDTQLQRAVDFLNDKLAHMIPPDAPGTAGGTGSTP